MMIMIMGVGGLMRLFSCFGFRNFSRESGRILNWQVVPRGLKYHRQILFFEIETLES